MMVRKMRGGRLFYKGLDGDIMVGFYLLGKNVTST